MKTVIELNDRAWYRLLKVIFILIIIFAAFIAIYVNYDAVGNYQTDYTVSCNYGHKSTFLAHKDKQIYIPSYYNYTFSLAKLPDDTKEELQAACGISQEELFAKMNNINDSKKLFELSETKIITDTYLSATFWSIISLLVILAIAEIIRRVFYYIVLGSLKPKNK